MDLREFIKLDSSLSNIDFNTSQSKEVLKELEGYGDERGEGLRCSDGDSDGERHERSQPDTVRPNERDRPRENRAPRPDARKSRRVAERARFPSRRARAGA